MLHGRGSAISKYFLSTDYYLRKLDEVKYLGKLFNLLHFTGLPLSYLSIGQRVPEDLELPNARRVVELIGGRQPQLEEDPTLLGVSM